MSFSRTALNLFIRLTCLIWAIPQTLPGHAQPAKPPGYNSEIVALPELEVVGHRYHWTYIKTANFELYSNLDDTDFIKKFATLQNACIDFVNSQFTGLLSGRTLQKKYLLCYESTRKNLFGVLDRDTIENHRSDLALRIYTYEDHKGQLYDYRKNSLAYEITMQDVLRDTIFDMVGVDVHLLERRSHTRDDWFRQALNCTERHVDEKSVLKGGDYKVILSDYEAALCHAASLKPDIADMLDGFLNGPRITFKIKQGTANLPPASGIQFASFNFFYYCMFGNPERYRSPLDAFLAWQAKHEPAEEMFTRIFGVNYKTMDNEIKTFYDKRKPNNIFPFSNATGKTANPRRNVIVEKVGRARSSRLLSDIYYVAGDPVRARQLLLNAAKEQPDVLNDPDFKAALALNELYAENGDREKAALYLEELARMKIQRPRIYAELAYLRMQASLSDNVKKESLLADPFFKNSDLFGTSDYAEWVYRSLHPSKFACRLPAGGVERAMEPLNTAFSMGQSQSLYVMLTAIWYMADSSPPENIINKIKEGCFLYPRNTQMLECVIDILKRNNKMDGVDVLLNNGFIYAKKRNESEVVDLAIKTYDIKDVIEERTKKGLLREQFDRFKEAMQKAKASAPADNTK